MSTPKIVLSCLAIGGIAALAYAFVPRDEVTFATIAAASETGRAGQKVAVAARLERQVTVTATFGDHELPSAEVTGVVEVDCSVDVAAMDKKGPLSAHVSFGSSTVTQSIAGNEEELEHPCSGQTFDAKRYDHGFAPTGRVTNDQRQAIARMCDAALGAPFSERIAGKELKYGTVIPVAPLEGDRALGLVTTNLAVRDMEITLTATRAIDGVESAHFAVRTTLIKARGVNDPSDYLVELTGEIVVSVQSLRILSCELTGSVETSGEAGEGAQRATQKGRGTLTYKVTAISD